MFYFANYKSFSISDLDRLGFSSAAATNSD